MPEPEPEPEIPSSSTTDDKNNDNNHNSDHALRFEAELEFVQCLANVPYLQCKLFKSSLCSTLIISFSVSYLSFTHTSLVAFRSPCPERILRLSRLHCIP